MTLKKETKIDRIEVFDNGVVNAREATRILDEDVEIATTYHRYVLPPGASLDGQTDMVRRVCQAVWSAEIIKAYESSLASAVSQA